MIKKETTVKVGSDLQISNAVGDLHYHEPIKRFVNAMIRPDASRAKMAKSTSGPLNAAIYPAPKAGG